jgi:hypothetical protein
MNWVILMKKVWFFHFLTLHTNEKKIDFDEKKMQPLLDLILGVSEMLNFSFFE